MDIYEQSPKKNHQANAMDIVNQLMDVRRNVSMGIMACRIYYKDFLKIIENYKTDAVIDGVNPDVYNTAIEAANMGLKACDDLELERANNIPFVAITEGMPKEYIRASIHNSELYRNSKISEETFKKNQVRFNNWNENSRTLNPHWLHKDRIKKLRRNLMDKELIEGITLENFRYLFTGQPVFDGMVRITPTKKLNNKMLFSLLKMEMEFEAMNYTVINNCFNLKNPLDKNSAGSTPKKQYNELENILTSGKTKAEMRSER